MDVRDRGRWLWVGAVVLALVFIPAGMSKLLATDRAVEDFARWGYASWFMYVVGTWEVLAGILVLVPQTRFYAAAFLALSMVGALMTHIVNAEWMFILLPLVVGSIAAAVAWTDRPEALEQARATTTHP